MAEEQEPIELVDDEIGVDLFEQHQNDLMNMFDELTFREKWSRVFEGLKEPPESGPHKWAKLQMTRLLSPVLAVIVPILMLGLITLFANLAPEPTRSVKVKVVEPEPLEDLEDIEEPVFDEIEPPDPVDVDFVTDTTLPPTEVAAPPQDVSVQPAEFDSVAMVKSPIIMKGIYGSRNPGSRGAALSRFGGTGTEAAVMRALRWMKKNQNNDGSWGKGNKPALASLILLAYLAHGETPSSEEFGSTVEKAIRYIVDAQETGGKMKGHFRGRDGHDYTQPICAYALSEAYGLTKVPKLKDAAIAALIPIVKGQNAVGGFNYNLKGPTDTRNDLSYIAWCVQALKAGKMAGLYSYVPNFDACWKKSVAGVKKNYKAQDGYGGFNYSAPGVGGLTGAGTLCLQFLGHANDRETRSALAFLNQAKFSWNKDEIDSKHQKDPVYYWYYLTQAKFQEGGAGWKQWNAAFQQPLMRAQDIKSKAQSGYVDHRGQPQEIGSWMPVPGTKMHGDDGTPLLSTIFCTLMLEVYYRYLPTFMPVPADDSIDDEIGDEDDDLEIDIVDSDRIPRTKQKRLAWAQDDDLEIDLS